MKLLDVILATTAVLGMVCIGAAVVFVIMVNFVAALTALAVAVALVTIGLILDAYLSDDGDLL